MSPSCPHSRMFLHCIAGLHASHHYRVNHRVPLSPSRRDFAYHFDQVLARLVKPRRMRSEPAWQAARALPHRQKQERAAAFAHLRRTYHFSEYDLHAYAKTARIAWMVEHLGSTMAQTLASRAYHAVNRMALGIAKRVRFKSKGRGIDSMEGKRNWESFPWLQRGNICMYRQRYQRL